MDFSKVKLVIWDLDDTFWQGTLSEGLITPIGDNISLVRDLTDRGIVNSICSKNDFEPTDAKLQELGVSDYFVFKSIDWTPKGQRIANLIKEMGLRPANCLFLDDNVVNLNEALFYSKELMIGGLSEIEGLIEFVRSTTPTDLSHKRLKQYNVLEEKQKAKSEAADNMAFLFSSNTQVEIHNDCLNVCDRIFELINRTNQLNFTKYRCTKEELDELLSAKDANCGYVTVKDKFGDYGIVGFFAIKERKCVHFLFSCRTIGQGVEQWVYSTLGWPDLNIVGEVVNTVEKIPAPNWINQKSESCSKQKDSKKISVNHKSILFKGPCDMEILTSFLDSTSVISEMTYIGESRHNTIEHHNHSVNYLQLPLLDEEEKMKLLDDCVFCDSDMFGTSLYDPDVKLIFLSTLIEPNLGIYRNKATGKRIAFGEWCYPLTDRANWEGFVSQSLNTYNNKFSVDYLELFASKYQYEGQESAEDAVENIKTLLSRLSKDCKLCLILGSETPYLKNDKKAYENREQYHQKLNQLVRKLSKSDNRLVFLDFNDYINSQEDFLDNINHFQRKVYYEASKQANSYIEQFLGYRLDEPSLWFRFISWLARTIRILFNPKSEMYYYLRKIYRKIRYSSWGGGKSLIFSIMRLPHYQFCAA